MFATYSTLFERNVLLTVFKMVCVDTLIRNAWHILMVCFMLVSASTFLILGIQHQTPFDRFPLSLALSPSSRFYRWALKWFYHFSSTFKLAATIIILNIMLRAYICHITFCPPYSYVVSNCRCRSVIVFAHKKHSIWIANWTKVEKIFRPNIAFFSTLFFAMAWIQLWARVPSSSPTTICREWKHTDRKEIIWCDNVTINGTKNSLHFRKVYACLGHANR